MGRITKAHTDRAVFIQNHYLLPNAYVDAKAIEVAKAMLKDISTSNCAYCDEPATLTCARCRSCRYHHADCQRAHWDKHRHVCKLELNQKRYLELIANGVPPIADDSLQYMQDADDCVLYTM